MTRRATGFTIVELIIVVVVIAILAAITIVAYTGITNRAKNSAAATAAEQAAKKVLTYAAVNADQYPTTLSEAGVTEGSATYQYRVDNASNPKTFCITATTQNVSYYVSSTSNSPAAGACAGHGVNGGGTITNLFIDPSLTGTSSAGYWSNMGTGGAGTRTTQTDGGAQGASYQRLRWTTPPAAGTTIGLGANVTSPATGGEAYSFSAYIRPSWASSFTVSILFINGSGGSSTATGSGVPSAAGTWSRLTLTATAPAGTVSMRPWVQSPSGATMPPANATLDVDGFMLTRTNSAPTYGDGDASDWTWDGAPNSSTSTGPAL